MPQDWVYCPIRIAWISLGGRVGGWMSRYLGKESVVGGWVGGLYLRPAKYLNSGQVRPVEEEAEEEEEEEEEGYLFDLRQRDLGLLEKEGGGRGGRARELREKLTDVIESTFPSVGHPPAQHAFGGVFDGGEAVEGVGGVGKEDVDEFSFGLDVVGVLEQVELVFPEEEEEAGNRPAPNAIINL